MNSFIKSYYIDVQSRIKSCIDTIKWVEQDFGQETSYKWRPSLDFPAVLLNFTSIKYENIALGGRTAVVDMTAKLVVPTYSQSYDLAPDDVKLLALEYFELSHELERCLHGWSPSNGYAQPLVLHSISTSNRGDSGLRVITLQLSTAYEEYADDKSVYTILLP